MLSVMTWAPFVSALIIMFFARRSPLLVRVTALLGASVSLVASLWVYWQYDRAVAGFQFQEQMDLVPSLGISYLLGVDGMSALLSVLTSIIIFAGVFASWTVKERGQEFYALLLLLVTGVYGVFVSLDLFVFFLFYEIAVLPMYLLIGIWGSSGEVRPQGIFGWAFGRTGVGTKEYAAMKLTLYLLFGSAFILVGILALYVAGGSQSFSFLTLQTMQFDPTLQSWVFLAFYVGFGILAGIWPLHTWSPDGHASAPTAVSMLHAGVLMKLGAYGVVRLGMGLLPEGDRGLGVARRHDRLHQHRLRRAQRDGADRPEVRHRVLVGVAHGRRDARRGDADGAGPERLRVPDVRARHHDRALLRAGRPRLREGALARDLHDGRLRPDDAGHRDRLHHRRPLVARAARDGGLRRRVPDVPRRVERRRIPGGCSRA